MGVGTMAQGKKRKKYNILNKSKLLQHQFNMSLYIFKTQCF